MTMLEILEKTRSLIAAGWTQGTYARDTHGNPCMTTNPYATKFCLVGALFKATEGEPYPDRLIHLLARHLSKIHGIKAYDQSCVVGWNDYQGRTQQDILQLLDSVILKLKKKEKNRDNR